MDVNKYITDITKNGLEPLNHINFRMVLNLDANNVHIPKWFKDKRVINLIDYCINEHIIDKNRIFYNFSFKYDPFNIKFVTFKIMDINLEQLTQLSHILPQPDLKELIKFKPSQPYHTSKFSVTEPPKSYIELKRSNTVTFYDLECILDQIETSGGTVLISDKAWKI